MGFEMNKDDISAVVGIFDSNKDVLIDINEFLEFVKVDSSSSKSTVSTSAGKMKQKIIRDIEKATNSRAK
jgi:hypothetical protein